MSKKATIIFANRQQGKTTRILEEAAKNNGIIVYPTQHMAECCKNQAKRTGLLHKIRNFINITKYRFSKGYPKKYTKFYFDEAGIELINSVRRSINKINQDFEMLTVDECTINILNQVLNDGLNMQTLDGRTILLNIQIKNKGGGVSMRTIEEVVNELKEMAEPSAESHYNADVRYCKRLLDEILEIDKSNTERTKAMII